MSQLGEILKDFLCGWVSGVVQVMVMQPFEIIKVRLINQSFNNPQYKGIKDCFRKIYQKEGWLAFYKGTASPLVGVGGQVAFQFGTNEQAKRMLEKFPISEDDDEDEEHLPMSLILLAGLITGIPSSILVTPIDHTRILVQLQRGENHKYSGSLDAGRQILKNYGIRGLYLGFNITLVREIIAMGVYYSTYQYIMRILARGGSTQKAPIMGSFLAGGFSGSCSWFWTYAVDYTKTIMQSQNLENRQFNSAFYVAWHQYRTEGFRTFFKGMGVTMLRSFPVNGFGFFSFEFMKRLTKRVDTE